MDARGDCVVVGSSDHALYEINVRKMKRTRTLYTKTYGHAEWVTSVRYLPDGRIISAGMDSKVFVWNASGVRATELKGHASSAGQIALSPTHDLMATSSYDKTIRLWRVGGIFSEDACLRKHKAPVLHMAWGSGAGGGTLASGSRDGALVLWNVDAAKPLMAEPVAHQGHCTSLAWFQPLESPAAAAAGGGGGESGLVLSGGQDGCVRGWDPRVPGCVFESFLHRNAGGAGAGGEIRSTQAGMVVSMGADKKISVSDPRQGLAEVVAITSHTDFIYSLEVVGDVIVSGAGDGRLLAHDVGTGDLLYALGGHAAAPRCLAVAGGSCLAATGDDGNVTIYDMAA